MSEIHNVLKDISCEIILKKQDAETLFYLVVLSSGNTIRVEEDIATGRTLLNAEDYARCIGHDSIENFMKTDTFLDAYSQWRENHGIDLIKGGLLKGMKE